MQVTFTPTPRLSSTAVAFYNCTWSTSVTPSGSESCPAVPASMMNLFSINGTRAELGGVPGTSGARLQLLKGTMA